MNAFLARKNSRKQTVIRRQPKLYTNNTSSVFEGGGHFKQGFLQVVTVIFVVALVYGVLYSGLLDVRHIVVVGNQSISRDQVEAALDAELSKRIGYVIPERNIIFLPKKNLTSALMAAFPQIASVNAINRQLPNTIRVQITERTPAFVWRVQSNLYLVGEDGVVSSQISPNQPPDQSLPIITDASNTPVTLGETLPVGQLAFFVEGTKNAWPSVVPAAISSIVIPARLTREVSFFTVDGWEAKFSIDRSIDDQLRDLARIVSGNIKPGASLRYIDLRIANTAYVCFKGDQCDSPLPTAAQPQPATPAPAPATPDQTEPQRAPQS